jgi:hypothetical protein
MLIVVDNDGLGALARSFQSMPERLMRVGTEQESCTPESVAALPFALRIRALEVYH